jgi:hypothetical protein
MGVEAARGRWELGVASKGSTEKGLACRGPPPSPGVTGHDESGRKLRGSGFNSPIIYKVRK